MMDTGRRPAQNPGYRPVLRYTFTMHRYQIKVRDPDGEPLGSVEFDAQNADNAVAAARDADFPAGSEFVPEKLDAITLWTVEDGDYAREVEAKSAKAAEQAAGGTAVAKRTVYPDSLIPVIRQGGPTPL
jgi:hypothetical protein